MQQQGGREGGRERESQTPHQRQANVKMHMEM